MGCTRPGAASTSSGECVSRKARAAWVARWRYASWPSRRPNDGEEGRGREDQSSCGWGGGRGGRQGDVGVVAIIAPSRTLDQI